MNLRNYGLKDDFLDNWDLQGGDSIYDDPSLISEPSGSDPYLGNGNDPTIYEPPGSNGPDPEDGSYGPQQSGSLSQILRLIQSGGQGAMGILGRLLGGSNGSGGLLQGLQRLLGGGMGLGTNILDNPLLIPALTSAMSQWRDSDRYMDSANQWADQADPFGRQREFYQGRLRNLMEDPQGYLQNDPGYQSTLRLALGPAESRMRARGYGNSGNIMSELNRQSGDITNTYLGQMADRLGRFAGADIDPRSAAMIRMQGLDSSVRARNGALDSLMYPFMATAFNQQGRNLNLPNNLLNLFNYDDINRGVPDVLTNIQNQSGPTGNNENIDPNTWGM